MDRDSRREAPIDGSELETLHGLLNYHRDTLRWKCSGLTDEQLQRSMEPTQMTLAGLVLHLTMVEAGWFNLSFAGGVSMPGWLQVADLQDPDWAWKHARDVTSEQLWAWFDEAVAVSDRVVAEAAASNEGLATVGADPEEPVSMRWLLSHMVEEYARHNGHADLLREAIDGVTGD
ncbi:DinB family protein [Nocardioides sp. IC4_145]|uniref:DinB family protein n=1 Tax=Nocardioides sp. IC4_145 TaxID=2714037 RepID=UPI00140AA57F|nr:DinB family protein [Nocardioides sp. IC4_145]NHC25233.1 DinB family protein [Nocardioides sp. IC4_145]